MMPRPLRTNIPIDDNTPPMRPREALQILGYCFRAALRTVATVGYVFTRRNFGRRYFLHPLSWAGVCYIAFWSSHTASPDTAEPIVAFAYAFLALCVWRMLTARHIPTPLDTRTDYTGYPLICGWFGVSERSAKLYIEPALCLVIGGTTMQLHASFGSMLAVTGVVMFLHQGCIEDDAVKHKRSMQAAEKKATAITQVYTQMNSKGRN